MNLHEDYALAASPGDSMNFSTDSIRARYSADGCVIQYLNFQG